MTEHETIAAQRLAKLREAVERYEATPISYDQFATAVIDVVNAASAYLGALSAIDQSAQEEVK